MRKRNNNNNNCEYESEKIVKKMYKLIYMLRTLTLSKIPKYLKIFSCFATYVHNFIFIYNNLDVVIGIVYFILRTNIGFYFAKISYSFQANITYCRISVTVSTGPTR